MIATRMIAWFIVALAPLACGGVPVTPDPPPIPIVPVSFETNLLTVRECDSVGTVEGVNQAIQRGASLIVVFEPAMQISPDSERLFAVAAATAGCTTPA